MLAYNDVRASGAQNIYHFFPFLNRHYFALSTNSDEQFSMFCTLAAWLITKAGHRFEQPQEYDQPNAVISNVLSELRSFVSVEYTVFPSVFQARASSSEITVMTHFLSCLIVFPRTGHTFPIYKFVLG